jgi:hypothetical protein
MAALDANDITVVVTDRWINGTKRYSTGTLAIAATDTYSTGGIPLPAKHYFGMTRQIDVLEVFGSAGNTTEYKYAYDRAAHTLVLYEEEGAAAGGPLLECDTAEVPGARTVRWHAIGW